MTPMEEIAAALGCAPETREILGSIELLRTLAQESAPEGDLLQGHVNAHLRHMWEKLSLSRGLEREGFHKEGEGLHRELHRLEDALGFYLMKEGEELRRLRDERDHARRLALEQFTAHLHFKF